MSFVTPTTELQAVNAMLRTIRTATVNSLVGTTNVDVSNAQNTLNEVARDVQSEGWNFNREHNYPLTRNGSNEIVLATNMIEVDIDHLAYTEDPVIRGTKVYDRYNHTFTWDKDLEASVTFLLPFTDLPEVARRYIVIRAARIFQDRSVGDDVGRSFTQQDEARARATLMSRHALSADKNVVRGRHGVFSTFTAAYGLNRR